MNLNPNTSVRPRGPWLLWTGLALLLLLVHALSFRFVIDDAYISFRFARNLVDGHGLGDDDISLGVSLVSDHGPQPRLAVTVLALQHGVTEPERERL